MLGKPTEYKIFAIRYATREARRTEHFIGGERHDAPMPMDYFTWVLVGPERTFLVDTGFTAESAARRRRQFLRCPIETLRQLEVEPESITDVILTHLHYDHAGNCQRLPNARFHLQERELAFATGHFMQYPYFHNGMEIEDVVGIVRLNYDGRVELHNGDVDLAPGLSLHLTPGHTAGMQVVRALTQRGNVVLASDSSHFYENFSSRRPFVAVLDVGETLDSFRRIEQLADSPHHIIPGHDPLVMKRYPSASSSLKDIVARLDVQPEE